MVSADILPARSTGNHPRLFRQPFDEIPRSDWDRLHALTSPATPFSAWTFHRAWWDAYASKAEEHYLVMEGDADDDPVHSTHDPVRIRAIMPLMIREAADDLHAPQPPAVSGGETAAGFPGRRSSRAMYFAATYHADYATALVADADVAGFAHALVRYLGEQLRTGSVDVVDLRRLAQHDPLLDHLAREWRDGSVLGLDVRRAPEDVCPVIDLADEWRTQLGRMDKKARHEIRRKLRRAEREGQVRLRYLPLDRESADRFIHLHQARWGSAGLFAEDEDGDRSRAFLRRLTELEASEGDRARFHLGEVTVDDQVVYALAGFAEGGVCYFYNAGMDPVSLDLSPGIVGTAMYLRDRIERGDRHFDFLRGDEPYKYQWGARDTQLERIVARMDAAA